jgi:hypothetical protein
MQRESKPPSFKRGEEPACGASPVTEPVPQLGAGAFVPSLDT